ncbi:MAG: hypothetical protein KTR25_00355 [Myxococcales bacterium]|nr:hypothetical protein [Myxococcales bacterium]
MEISIKCSHPWFDEDSYIPWRENCAGPRDLVYQDPFDQSGISDQLLNVKKVMQ